MLDSALHANLSIPEAFIIGVTDITWIVGILFREKRGYTPLRTPLDFINF